VLVVQTLVILASGAALHLISLVVPHFPRVVLRLCATRHFACSSAAEALS
jgi:hypothetical protein